MSNNSLIIAIKVKNLGKNTLSNMNRKNPTRLFRIPSNYKGLLPTANEIEENIKILFDDDRNE